MDYEDRLSVCSVKMAIVGPKTIATHVNKTCKRFIKLTPYHHGPLLFLWNPVFTFISFNISYAIH